MSYIKMIFVFLILVFLVWHIYFNYWKDYKKNKKMFCYETYNGPANGAMIITDLEYKESLIEYYRQMEKINTPIFDFPLLTLPVNEPVYIVDYIGKDSLIVEVVSYYDRGIRFGGNFLHGYVYSKTLHDSLPGKKENNNPVRRDL